MGIRVSNQSTNPNSSSSDSSGHVTPKKNNYCYLVGNLGMDPAERGKGKSSVVGFSVAENVSKYNEETKAYETLHTNWFNVTAFGELADAAKRQLRRGDRVTIEGRMRMSKYLSKSGEEKVGFEILADKLTPWHRAPKLDIDDKDLPF